jgi:hypothetical protein
MAGVFVRVLPLLARGGGSSGIKKSSEASLPRDGVVVQSRKNSLFVIDPPPHLLH